MYRITHVYVGFVAGLFFSRGGVDALLNGLFGGLGGFIPDFDLKFSHRKTLHNFIVPTLILIAMLVLTNQSQVFTQQQSSILTYVSSFTAGWFLHIAVDSLTVKGVYPLYPLSRKTKLRIAKLRSQSLLANTLVLLVASIVLGYWFYKNNIYREIENLLRLSA